MVPDVDHGEVDAGLSCEAIRRREPAKPRSKNDDAAWRSTPPPPSLRHAPGQQCSCRDPGESE